MWRVTTQDTPWEWGGTPGILEAKTVFPCRQPRRQTELAQALGSWKCLTNPSLWEAADIFFLDTHFQSISLEFFYELNYNSAFLPWPWILGCLRVVENLLGAEAPCYSSSYGLPRSWLYYSQYVLNQDWPREQMESQPQHREHFECLFLICTFLISPNLTWWSENDTTQAMDIPVFSVSFMFYNLLYSKIFRFKKEKNLRFFFVYTLYTKILRDPKSNPLCKLQFEKLIKSFILSNGLLRHPEQRQLFYVSNIRIPNQSILFFFF